MDPKEKETDLFERGVYLMLLSATCLSFSFLFIKYSLEYLNYYLLVFLRFLFPLVFIGVFTLLSGEWKLLLKKPQLLLQISRAFCVLLSQYAFAYYLTQRSLLNATVLLNAGPLFIPFLERIFLKHPIGKSTLAGAIVSLIGVILVLHPDSSILTPISAIGLIAALGQAGSQVFFGIGSKKENLSVSLFYLFFITTFISGIIYVMISDTALAVGPNVPYEHWVIYIVLTLIGITTVGNQFFRGLAYRHSTPSKLSTFLYFSVFVSGLLDILIFHKIPTFLTVMGGILIIFGGVLKILLRAHILRKKDKH